MIEQSLWKILAFMIAVVLIFVAPPTITIYDRMDAITYNVVESEVSRFCDVVRDTGVITEKSYNAFLAALGQTGVTYEVTIEHNEKLYVPVYVGSVFQDRYEIIYDNHYSDTIADSLRDGGAVGNSYHMSVGGDMFYVHVENQSATKSQTIKQLFLGGVSSKYPVIVVRNGGGMVRHESD